jgi:hypothetical protein
MGAVATQCGGVWVQAGVWGGALVGVFGVVRRVAGRAGWAGGLAVLPS